jgi:hypothetical protein
LKACTPERGSGRSKPASESFAGVANEFAVAVAAEREFMGATRGDGTDWSGDRNALV